MVLNEHHQKIYGLMPSPNLIAAALTQRSKRGKIVVLGNLLPLHCNPLRVAEEYAMLDNMSGGRLIAGFAVARAGDMELQRAPALAREQFWEAVDLIKRAWTEAGRSARGQALSAALRESVAAAAAASRGRRSGCRAAVARNAGRDAPSAATTTSSPRALTASTSARQRFGEILGEHGGPFSRSAWAS